MKKSNFGVASLLVLVLFVSVQPVLFSFDLNQPEKATNGIASWYSEKDPLIRLHTASGEVFDDSKRTCASWDFPFGTYLQVVNLENGRSVTCRVNDRGPAKYLGRRIDLTKAAFHDIADLRLGLIKVSVAVMPRSPGGMFLSGGIPR